MKVVEIIREVRTDHYHNEKPPKKPEEPVTFGDIVCAIIGWAIVIGIIVLCFHSCSK